MAFAERLAEAAAAVETVLATELDRLAADRAPARLVEATRYALLGGGKRFRPFLVIETARVLGGPQDAAARVGAAFEALHAYSLVHDDLPAMDDDDLRRGRPTVHKAFDEATAILVGDGLQAFAFELVASPPVPQTSAGPLAVLLADAAGLRGMVGGQYRDLHANGLDEEGVALMQAMKTGALLCGACEAGAVLSGANGAARQEIARFGSLLGRAFQLADDLLDIEGTVEEVGKRVGKDADGGKVTIASLLGPQKARERLHALVAEAASVIGAYGAEADALVEACHFVANRRS